MNNIMEIQSLDFRQTRCFHFQEPIHSSIHFLLRLFYQIFKHSLKIIARQMRRKIFITNIYIYIYIFTSNKSDFRHLETDQADLTLTRDFVFNEQNFNRNLLMLRVT